MQCKDNYRLELHWKRIEYHNDSIIKLHDAYLSGPVLKTAKRIEDKDSINLDLTPQHLVVLKSYYIIKLEWNSVKYLPLGIVSLGGATLSNEHLKTLHKLEDKDFILIDTEKHEHTTHAAYLSYTAEVVRQDRKPYKYTR